MVILDEPTRKELPGASNLFLNPSFPMSGNFGGTVPPEKVQKIHINPAKAVRTVSNKPELYKSLERAGNPVGNWAPVSAFKKDGVFDLNGFIQQFGDENGDLDQVELHNALESMSVSDMMELLEFIQKAEKSGTNPFVASQTQLEAPTTGYVRAIPNAQGHKLNTGSRDITDGVLSHNIPVNRMSTGAGTKVVDGALKAIEDIDLDYATAILRFDAEGNFEIVDISPRLVREDAISLRSYAGMLHKKATEKRK